MLFVHGIGQQRRGETLIRFGEPLARAVQDRLTSGAAPAALRPDQPGVVAFERASLDEDGAPPHAEVTVKNVSSFRSSDGAAADSRWLFAEAWWAELFPTPTFTEIARWSFDIVPWTLIGHFDTRLRRAWFRFRQAATLEEEIAATLAWLSQVVYLSAVVLAAPLLVAVLFATLVLTALPIPFMRDVAGAIQRLLAATIGDSYVLVGWPIARASILSRVSRDFHWLEERSERIMIVAHSQGAAIAHEFLRQEPLVPCDRLITFGSGLRKLSEVRQAVESASRVWLRLLSLSGLAVALLSGVAVRFAGTARWAAVVGLGLALALTRIALLKWRKANDRSVRSEEQWIADRRQYLERYRLPQAKRMSWLDLFASADPVPNGPLFDDLLPDEMRARGFHNLHSTLTDHTGYFRNADEFLARVSWETFEPAGIDGLKVDPDDWAKQSVASARRGWRIGWLRVGRWSTLAACLTMLASWWQDAPPIFEQPVAQVSAALGLIPKVGATLAQHSGPGLGHLPGILVLALSGLGFATVLRLSWNWWNTTDARHRYTHHGRRAIDGPSGLLFAWMATGVAVVSWSLWARGDHAVPVAVVTMLAVVAALVAIGDITGLTEILASCRASCATGEVLDADKRLNEYRRRYLQRGVKRGRGWAAFELGFALTRDDEAKAIQSWKQALDMGFGLAAWYLALHFRDRDPSEAAKFFKIGMDKGDPACAWFLGRLLQEQGKLNEAVAIFRAGMTELRSPECAHNLGGILNDDLKDPEGARAVYEEGATLGDGLSAKFLGDMLRVEAAGWRTDQKAAGDRAVLLRDCEHSYRRALELGTLEALVGLADILQERGDIDKAKNILNAGMRLRIPRAAFELGKLATKEGEHALAQQSFVRCIDLAEGQPLALEAAYHLGNVLDLQQRPAAAERMYRKALGTDGAAGFAPAAAPLANLVRKTAPAYATAEELRTIYRRGIALKGTDAAILLARFEEQEGSTGAAIEAYRAASDLDSKEGAQELGRLLEQTGDETGAKAAYFRAWRLGAGLPEAWLQLVERSHDAASAAAAIDETSLFPGDQPLLRLGKVLEAAGDFDRAAQGYARAYSADAMFALGDLHERQGRAAEALASYEQAMGLGSGRAAFKVGRLREARGDVEGARSAYQYAEAAGFSDYV